MKQQKGISRLRRQSSTSKEGQTLMKQLKEYQGWEYKATPAKKEKPWWNN